MKVLLASDGSDHAFAAAKFLSLLAGKEKFHVTIFTVSYNPGHAHQGAIEPWYPEWSDHETKRVGQDQQRLCDLIDGCCDRVEMKHVFGDPVPLLLHEAKVIDADLIVLGAKGHTMLHRLLLGSTSDSVATHAECSVLVVRSKPDRETPLGDPPKLLIGYDGSTGSREAIAEQLSLNWPPKTEVHLVSVAAQAYEFFDDTYAAMAAAYENEHVERMRTDAEKMCGEISKTLPSTSLQVPRVNHIGDAIVNAAEQNGDELIVVGDTGHTMIGELFLGSTTKYVLRHAGCSVWISRHHRRQAIEGE